MERVRAGLRIPYELNTRLILRAQAAGISKNALILQILWDWAQREGCATNDLPKDRNA